MNLKFQKTEGSIHTGIQEHEAETTKTIKIITTI